MGNTHFLHPGEILKMEFLEGYNLSIAKAAAAMGMTRARLNEIVVGRRGISADSALRLARFFGGDAQFWLNLQDHYDLAEAEAAAGKHLAAIKPGFEFDVPSRGGIMIFPLPHGRGRET